MEVLCTIVHQGYFAFTHFWFSQVEQLQHCFVPNRATIGTSAIVRWQKNVGWHCSSGLLMLNGWVAVEDV